MTSRIKTNAIWAGLCSFFSSDLEGIKIFSWDAKIIVALDTAYCTRGSPGSDFGVTHASILIFQHP